MKAGASVQTVNIADALSQRAKEQPYTPAIFSPSGFDGQARRRYVHWTYSELDGKSDAIAAGLSHYGLHRGARVALMVPPSLDFFALVFGLFKAGVAPVLIDPGIGTKPLKICLAESEPEGFIGIAAAQAARTVLGWARGHSKVNITVGGGWFGPKLADLIELGQRRLDRGDWKVEPTSPAELAAILFTSGSTGIPKGAMYSHGNFAAQVQMIGRAYDIEAGEVDLPTFPPFALFDPALGMTTVLPEMDFRRPASVDPERIREAIEGFGVTNMFGSPALLNTVSRWAVDEGVRFSTLRRVISAGAPVPTEVLARTRQMMAPEGKIHTPYGATESLPVASIESREVLEDTGAQTLVGGGVCVGLPVAPAQVRIIEICDEPIASWSDASELAQGEIGEITVASPTVTSGYWGRPHQSELAKITELIDGQACLVHRMGDVGYRDAQGRVWFCGRKSQRVQTSDGPLYTSQIEAVFNRHPDVYRTALVGIGAVGHQHPVLCVELAPGTSPNQRQLFGQLADIAKSTPLTAAIETFIIHPGFPVDIRHNAKIGREALGKWAAKQVSR
ncbi:MAG TPA: peptide synthase [Myxococcales bacterium]|nr:peptide synthase [Myxococcales bacterium]HAN32227.1 peptide synthase [Myxococcales bacterium]